MFPILLHAPFPPQKGRQRPSTHGSKTNGRQTRNDGRKRPSISTPRFNRNRDKLAGINLALLRHRNSPPAPPPQPRLPPRPTARTVCPRDRSRTTLPVTRLSIRHTRAIINITLHIIIITCDPHLHLSAHRIIRGISQKFYPSRRRPLRTACRSRGDRDQTVLSRSSSRTFSPKTHTPPKRKGRSWASPSECESTPFLASP